MPPSCGENERYTTCTSSTCFEDTCADILDPQPGPKKCTMVRVHLKTFHFFSNECSYLTAFNKKSKCRIVDKDVSANLDSTAAKTDDVSMPIHV